MGLYICAERNALFGRGTTVEMKRVGEIRGCAYMFLSDKARFVLLLNIILVIVNDERRLCRLPHIAGTKDLILILHDFRV